jgi:hypothetical protein
MYQFPREAKYELIFNSQHFYQTIEGHSGGFLFHFEALKSIYGSGDWVILLVFISLFWFLVKMKDRSYRIAVISSIFLVYAFYTLVKTKMIAFGVIVSPFVYLAFASLTCFLSDWIIRWSINKRPFQFFQILLFLFLSFYILNFQKFTHKWQPKNRGEQMAHALNLKQLELSHRINKWCTGEKWAIFNASIRPYGYIEVMFFTHAMAYDFIPTNEQISIFKKKGFSIAIVDNGLLPDDIVIDSTISKIKLD